MKCLQRYKSRQYQMSSEHQSIDKEVILLSGGVESTTMLHMKNTRFLKARGNIMTSPNEFIIPLFINYGAAARSLFVPRIRRHSL
jgi:hypothetical protein